jgi:hypothetical protein
VNRETPSSVSSLASSDTFSIDEKVSKKSRLIFRFLKSTAFAQPHRPGRFGFAKCSLDGFLIPARESLDFWRI